MKKFLLAILILFTVTISAQIVNIPDANFKNALLAHDPVIDTNSDGEIQESEAANFTESLDVSDNNISDLTGIESFTSITYLLCGINQISNINMAALPQLTSLQCQLNQITNLDLSLNKSLFNVNIGSNNISSITLPPNNGILGLYAGNNEISNIDLSGSPNLRVVVLDNNQVKNIDLSNNTLLMEAYLDNNNLNEIDVSQNAELSRLHISGNSISQLNLNKNLWMQTLVFSNTLIQSLDLSLNNLLLGLVANNTSLTELNIKNGANEIMLLFDVTNNPSLSCIEVDDEVMANNGTGPYEDWLKDETAIYSENCKLSVDSFSKTTINAYPNPTNAEFTIETDEFINSISIISMTGQKIFDKNYDDIKTTLDVSSLVTGVYFLRINFKNGQNRIIKMLKN